MGLASLLQPGREFLADPGDLDHVRTGRFDAFSRPDLMSFLLGKKQGTGGMFSQNMQPEMLRSFGDVLKMIAPVHMQGENAQDFTIPSYAASQPQQPGNGGMLGGMNQFGFQPRGNWLDRFKSFGSHQPHTGWDFSSFGRTLHPSHQQLLDILYPKVR